MTKKATCIANAPIAVMGITNTMGAAIHCIEYGIEDYVYASLTCGDCTTYHKCKLHSKLYKDGRDSTYFYIGKMKMDLNNFIRV